MAEWNSNMFCAWTLFVRAESAPDSAFLTGLEPDSG